MRDLLLQHLNGEVNSTPRRPRFVIQGKNLVKTIVNFCNNFPEKLKIYLKSAVIHRKGTTIKESDLNYGNGSITRQISTTDQPQK